MMCSLSMGMPMIISSAMIPFLRDRMSSYHAFIHFSAVYYRRTLFSLPEHVNVSLFWSTQNIRSPRLFLSFNKSLTRELWLMLRGTVAPLLKHSWAWNSSRRFLELRLMIYLNLKSVLRERKRIRRLIWVYLGSGFQ
jgi:hypothetical protein